MTATTNLSLLDLLQEALTDKYSEERDGVHISSICLCPRESVFRTIDPKPLVLTEIMFFVTGESFHTALQYLMSFFGRKRIKIEKHVRYKGVVGTIDLVVDDIPIEVKTHRGKHDEKFHYVEQLKCYLAMLKKTFGKILLVGLVQYNQPFQVYDIHTTEEENKARLKWIESEAKQYREAVEKGDWKIARAVKDHPKLYWKCKSCKWQKPCWQWENEKTT